MSENSNGIIQQSDGAEKETKRGIAVELYEWAQALVYSVVFVVVLFTFFVRIIGVDGTSMIPTLQHNDKIVVTNMFYEPSQGDIIVLRKESFLEEPIVKRVIATEGQTVDIDFISHNVYVDGIRLDEPYIKLQPPGRGMSAFRLPSLKALFLFLATTETTVPTVGYQGWVWLMNAIFSAVLSSGSIR